MSARRLQRWSAAGLLLAAAVAGPACAAHAATTAGSFYVPLTADLDVPATVASPFEEYVVVQHDLNLVAGEQRRVSDQLVLTLSSEEGAGTNNIVACYYLDAGGWQQVERTSAGTNIESSSAGAVTLNNQLLLHAEHTGSYRCEIRMYATDAGRTDFHMTALHSPQFSTTGTWLRFSSADEVGAVQWRTPLCPSGDVDGICQYLQSPVAAYVLADSPHWVAAADATAFDVVGTLQFTSCPQSSASCPDSHHGDGATDAYLNTFLQFDQLRPDGSLCRLHQSYDVNSGNRYRITNHVHHQPVSYHLTAPVAADCGGSRTFALKIYAQWVSGNPIKVDGGNVDVITSTRAATATVPYVLGAQQEPALAALRAQGFVASVANTVVDPAPPGTVIGEDSPGGTVEPAGSIVYLTVSRGRSVVPDVRGDSESTARRVLAGAGLVVGSVTHPDTCVDPGFVYRQSPAAGTVVVPGTVVNLTVPSCSSGTPK